MRINRLRLHCALLLLAGACFSAGVPAAANPADAAQPVGLGDFFAVRTVADPQIAPDGDVVAYVLTTPDVRTDTRSTAVRLVSVRDGRDVALAGELRDSRQPRWSPQGDRLAYVSIVKGRVELFVAKRDGTAAQRIAVLPAPPIALSWSPHGDRLAYLASVPTQGVRALESTPPPGASWARPAYVVGAAGFQTATAMLPPPVEFHLYVVAARGEDPPRRVTAQALGRALPYTGGTLAWSHDGERVLAGLTTGDDSWKYVMGSRLYSIDVTSGAVRMVAGTASSSQAPTVAADGRLAFLCMTAGPGTYFDRQLCAGPGEDGPFDAVHADLDRPVVAAQWAPNGRGLYATYLDEGMARLAWFGVDGSRRVLATTGGGDVSSYAASGGLSVARDGTVAFAFGDPSTPSEIAVVKPGRKPRVLTRVNADYVAARVVNPVDQIRYRSTDDRYTIHAWMVKPRDFTPERRYPTIVLIHGGQSSDFGPDFDLIPQVMAAHGYVVVMPNYRGSGSYGRAFGGTTDYPVGTDADVVGAIDFLVAAGVTDPERTFIVGGSGGGLITGWTIGSTTRFRAAAMWYAPIEWSQYLFEAATGPTTLRGTFSAPPWEAPAEHVRRSPFYLVGKVTTPTMLSVGENDRVTPLSQSIAYFTALQYRGVPSRLSIWPEEPHGIRAYPSHQMSHLAETLGWFADYGGQPLAPSTLAVP